MNIRRTLLAGLAALAIATPAAAETIWSRSYGNWTVGLDMMDGGAPLCSWRTQLLSRQSVVGAVQFAMSPGMPVFLSVAMGNDIAPARMDGAAVLQVGRAIKQATPVRGGKRT